MIITKSPSHRAVTSIDLKKNDIGAEGAASLADALKVNSTITSMPVSYSRAGDWAVRLERACEWNARFAEHCACMEMLQHFSEAGLVRIIFGYCDMPWGKHLLEEPPKLEEKLEALSR